MLKNSIPYTPFWAIERRFGRRAVIDEVVAALSTLSPTGGLLTLTRVQWKDVFTTNFDQLVEASYKTNGNERTVIRSNYDLTQKEDRRSNYLQNTWLHHARLHHAR